MKGGTKNVIKEARNAIFTQQTLFLLSFHFTSFSFFPARFHFLLLLIFALLFECWQCLLYGVVSLIFVVCAHFCTPSQFLFVCKCACPNFTVIIIFSYLFHFLQLSTIRSLSLALFGLPPFHSFTLALSVASQYMVAIKRYAWVSWMWHKIELTESVYDKCLSVSWILPPDAVDDINPKEAF